MRDYKNFDKKIVALMEKLSGEKNAMYYFGRIEMVDFDRYLEVLNKSR